MRRLLQAGAGLFLPGLLLAMALGAVALPASAAAVITGVRLAHQDDTTRVVLDLTEAVPFAISVVENPHRVVIDLPATALRLPSGDQSRSVGVVHSFQYRRLDSQTWRIVVNLVGPVEVSNAFLLPPDAGAGHRLVVDFRATNSSTFVASNNGRAFAARPRPGAAPGPQTAPFVVVIDAGHGGRDPGALGISGIREKDVTLAASIELMRILAATGQYRVVLTRDDDTFIPLRDRVKLARNAGADLFVSIHADHHRNPNMRGASVYTLSETASDKEAAALARRENWADAFADVEPRGSADVAAILISLGQREAMNLSSSFANLLVPEFGRGWRTIQNPHRFAGFAVLTAPDVPSVLVELGYLSNIRDERILSTTSGRNPVIAAIARAVDRYFAARARETHFRHIAR